VHRTGNEIEVGELVVEQEAAHHDAAAERVLDGTAHGNDIALRIGDREVGGAVRLGIARRRLAHGSLADQACSAVEVLSIQEFSNRTRYKIRTSAVASTVRVGEPPGL